ncbi:ankyrin repeat-containing domain protein [Boeremia exigua]|uniref:ankyrin repeat-containing domain protein n=1 Tax=Boeremia exigua TaxID=749465 RepID=UPI001E8CFBF0|nr:ankyrin repeat-containing domain protein [Boeremia exigua]KAH6638763.1 ankyrin repeat-containing domain protein [Boeremia exigua]
MSNLDEDSVDEILYLARANEASELEQFLATLSTQISKPKDQIIAEAADSYSQNTALHYAAANGHNDIIKLLLSTSSTKPAPFLNLTNASGNTALHWASLNGHLEAVKLLIEAGGDITIFNKAGHDAVFEAEVNDKKEVVDWLLGHVEALEKSVGGGPSNGEGSAGADEDMVFKAGDTSGPMEDVTEKMGEMQTKDTQEK